MRYALLLHGHESEGETPSQLTDEMRLEWQRFFESAEVSEALVSSVPLFPTSESNTVRVRNGRRLVTDGPFAETKEQLGGVIVLELPSLEDAIEIAGRAPCLADGSVEVRPVFEPPE